MQSLLLVIAGPSGSGKTTLAEGIDPSFGVGRCVTTTTRPPREDEIDGVHYHFLHDEVFSYKVACGEFVEHVAYARGRYGTQFADLLDAMAKYRIVVLVIEVQGYFALKQHHDERIRDALVGVFVDTSDPATIAIRLRERDQGKRAGDIELRLVRGVWERSHKSAFDHRIINDDLATASADLHRFIRNRLSDE